MEIVTCCLDSVDIVKETIAAIEQAMIVDIDLIGNYGFPPALPIEVECGIGYSWGEEFSLEEYLGVKAGVLSLEECFILQGKKVNYKKYAAYITDGGNFEDFIVIRDKEIVEEKKQDVIRKAAAAEEKRIADEKAAELQKIKDAEEIKEAIANAEDY